MRRRHGVDGQQIQRRRAIDQDVAVSRFAKCGDGEWRKRIAQAESAIARLTDFEFEAGEIKRRWREIKPRDDGRQDRVVQSSASGKHIVGGKPAAALVDAEAGRGIALRVEVDDQHVLADSGERGAEIYGGRGFPDAAFLIGHRQDASVPYRLGPNFAAGQLLVFVRRRDHGVRPADGRMIRQNGFHLFAQ